MKNPWEVDIFGTKCTTADLSSRLQQIKYSNDVEWLKAVITYRHNQKAVTEAAQRKLRKLQKVS